VIEGNLLLEGPSSRALGRPLPILLVELGSGTRTIVESFSDGSFYRMGLPPGRYEATVEAAVLDRLGLGVRPIRFELRPSRSAGEPGPTVSGLRLLLRPR